MASTNAAGYFTTRAAEWAWLKSDRSVKVCGKAASSEVLPSQFTVWWTCTDPDLGENSGVLLEPRKPTLQLRVNLPGTYPAAAPRFEVCGSHNNVLTKIMRTVVSDAMVETAAAHSGKRW